VIRAAPGPRIGLWSYTSIGGATLQEGALEFCIHAEHADDRFVELLAMCVHYHRSEALGFGHTFPVGEFKIAHGLEALERRFESEKIPYWNLQRASVV
jgi:hypothetical protein